MLLALTLLILGVIGMFSMVLGAGLTNTPLDTQSSGSIIINGTTTAYETSTNMMFTIDPNPMYVGLGILFGLIAIASLFGLKILGSGLSEESVRVIIFVCVFGGIWSLLSILAYSLIVSIEIFGYILYAILTICYVYGVIKLYYGSG